MKAIVHLKNKLVNVFTSSTNRTNEPSTSAPLIEENCVKFDILAKKTMSSSIHQKFVLTFEGNEDVEAKRTCKVLKFPTSFSFDAVLAEVSKLDSKCNPNLFMFVIEAENFGFCGNNQEFHYKIKNMQDHLLKFSETRPLILQITSVEEKVTKIYFKNENSTFMEIERPRGNDAAFNDFPSFLQQFLTTKITNFEGLMLQKLPVIKDSPIIIRFLRTLRMPKNFFAQLALKCASEGSKSDILAVIDAPFEGDGRILNSDAETWLNQTISIKHSSSQQNQAESEHSILHTAIINKNEEIVDYLTSHCVHLIQQLPFEHQVKISTTAFVGKHIDVLCDLLEICDFPFPENFNAERTENQKLNNIIDDRREFIQAIAENELKPERISKFIKDNPNLNIVYNFNNESALYQAFTTEHYKAYFHLKSIGFQAVEFDDVDDILSGDELREANKYAAQQRNLNVQASIMDSKLPILLLTARSSIHDRKTKSEKEAKCREKIRKWFEDIFNSKFGSLLLRTASMCNKLKIIFDFESDSVENVSLQSRGTLGSMYPRSKWIFIGAKSSSDINREQQIKGVLAHELCHYVMRLIFENSEEPYFKHVKVNEEMFKVIVKSVDKWSKNRRKNPDDKCDEIISEVYRGYNSDDWIVELIVRVPQIFAHYDNDDKKITSLEALYVTLFEYYERSVVPEMARINLEEREKVRKLNKTFGILPNISKEKFEFSVSKDIKSLLSSKPAIVQSNIPSLLKADINNYICNKYGNMFDAYNIFLNLGKLKDGENLKTFSEVMSKSEIHNVIVDASNETEWNVNEVIKQTANFVFVVSNEEQREKMRKKLEDIKMTPGEVIINYNWNDLAKKSLKMLLQRKIIFQDGQHSFYDILWGFEGEPSEEDQDNIFRDSSEIVDEQLLNLLVNDEQISIETKLTYETSESDFYILFRKRSFIKSGRFESNEIAQENICSDAKTDSYVLLSDIAGTGKSWAMKKITRMLRGMSLKSWVTYVDLKQHIIDFKLILQIKNETKFLNFMMEKVFATKNNFEKKFFEKLYKKGKIFILFDGFDEIAPDYANFVTTLVKSFEANSTNQLWIATRDYFEVDLKQNLNLNVSYKLKGFTKDEEMELIVENSILNDLNNRKIPIDRDFDNQVKNHKDYEVFKETARILHEKTANWNLSAIGLPILCKIIGKVLTDYKDCVDDFNEFNLFDKFVDHHYEMWSTKGEIRRNKNKKNQKQYMKYRELHQYIAMKTLFPENSQFCDLELSETDWKEEEILGCGILSKRGDQFYFPHETLREFFVAEFIIRILNLPKQIIQQFDQDVFEYLIKLSMDKKFGVIQMFLKHAFNDNLKLQLPENQLTVITTNVPKLVIANIYKYLQEKYGKLVDRQKKFIIPDDLETHELHEDFGYSFIHNTNFEIAVDSSNETEMELKKIIGQNMLSFILINSDVNRLEKLTQILKQNKLNPENKEINYNWNDLRIESRKMLIETKINFQGSEMFLLDLLLDDFDKDNINNDYISGKVEGGLLNLLMEKSQININTHFGVERRYSRDELLYQERKFVKKQQNELTALLTEKELLKDVTMKPYVLISDVAGSGKTLAMKMLAIAFLKNDPKKWTTFVDLKEFIREFKSQQETNVDFLTFMIEKILKLRTTFEAKLFTKFYQNGRVNLIFDGFDEIAPDYEEFVIQLIILFEFNGGNQLWISTRDFFEEKLKSKRRIDAVYKLEELTTDDGINIIAKSWVLNDHYQMGLKDDFEKHLTTSANFEKYKEEARQILKKFRMSDISSIGLAQLFKMIGDGIQYNRDISLDMSLFKIFSTVADKYFILWSHEKGEIRAQSSIDSPLNELTFLGLHQYLAMKQLFPEMVDTFFPDYDRADDWTDEEIIACGLVNKKDESFIFVEGTFCEFFVAHFIARTLRRIRGKRDVLELIVKILTIKKHGVIRMFLNDVFEPHLTLKKIQSEIQPEIHKFIKNFYEMDNFSEFFTKNLANLADFVIEVLKHGKYENVKELLFKNATEIFSHTSNPKLLLKFQDFLLDFVIVADLGTLREEQKFLQNVTRTEINAEFLENLIKKIDQKLEANLGSRAIKKKHRKSGKNCKKVQNECRR